MIESRWSTTGEWFKSAQPVSRSNVKIGRYLELVSKTMDIQYLEDPYDNAVLKALTEFLIFAMFVPVIKDRRFARPVDPDLSITKPVDITVQKYGTDSEGEPYYLASHLYDTTRVLLGGLGPLLGELTGMLQMFPEVAAELEVLTETELYSKLDPNKEPYHDDNWSVILSVIGTVSKKRYDIIARDMMPSLALMIGGGPEVLEEDAKALVESYYKLIGRPLKPELYSIFGAQECLIISVMALLLVDLPDLLEPLTIEDLNEYEMPLVPPVELRGLKLTDDSAHQWFLYGTPPL